MGDVRNRPLGRSEIAAFGKDVRKLCPDDFHDLPGSVNVYFFIQYVIEGAYIVEPGDMIAMLMGEEYGIQVADLLAQHLDPEIGPAIHHQGHSLRFNENGSPEPLVTGIGRETNRAFTGDHRHPDAGSRSQESNPDIIAIGCVHQNISSSICSLSDRNCSNNSSRVEKTFSPRIFL